MAQRAARQPALSPSSRVSSLNAPTSRRVKRSAGPGLGFRVRGSGFGKTESGAARTRKTRPLAPACGAARGATAFAGTWTAGRLGGRGPAAFVGLLLLAAALFNVSMLPYPLWFKAAAPAAILTAAAWGYRLSSRRARPAGNATG